jgi:hypothetical protein
MYSIACKPVKNKPSKTVINNPIIVSILLPPTKALCAQVTVTPELNKTIVFNKGTLYGFNVSRPTGGQSCISNEGFILE